MWNVLQEPLPEMATTHREAIWKKNKATLWYYPPKKKKFNVPIFIVYSLISQPFILDLGPKMSMIEAFREEGYEVYLLDFGIPGYEDGDISMDDYIVDYIQKGAQRSLRHSGAQEISVIGFCLGGTLAAMYTTIAEEPIKNLILSTTPIDFSFTPIFKNWSDAIRNETIDVEELIVTPVIPSEFVRIGMRLLSSPVYVSPYLSLLARVDDEQYVNKWRRLNEWTNAHIPLTGAALKQLINDLGKHNKLIKGKMFIRKKRASLKNITCNLLVVSGAQDLLVPKEMSEPIMKLVSSEDKQFTLLSQGHSGISTDGKLPNYLAEWLPKRSEPI
ncbi:alpha/beta fold hydrolase [Bacillus sp. CGMCC 1.16607]|uniref:alpha/beta fold hydrolase n=1 Tax=Bacillus sp. CGMCC 1.16607 TaxID=3351842 RepID=UPI003641BFC5